MTHWRAKRLYLKAERMTAALPFPAKHTVTLKKACLQLYRKKYSGFSCKWRKKKRRMTQRNTTSCIFEQVHNSFQFSRGASSQILLVLGMLGVVWNNSIDNLPLHSRLMHCSIWGELMGKGDPIRAEPEYKQHSEDAVPLLSGASCSGVSQWEQL